MDRASTAHFGGGTGAGNERVVRGAGCNKGGLESARERQHSNENAHGSGNTRHRNDRGGPASFDAPNVINDGDGHFQTLLKALTTRMRIAPIPGSRPLAIPTTRANPRPTASSDSESIRGGR